MSTEEENIQALSRAVMTEARSEAEQTLADAKRKVEVIRSESQNQVDGERAKIMENANKEAARIRSQAIAAAHLRARTLLLEQREKLLNDVFEKAVQRVADVQKDSNYKSIALALLKEALGHLGSDSALIQADSRTQELLTHETLGSIADEMGIKLDLGEPLEQGIGVIVQTVDGHRRYDNTLEIRLKRMQDSLRNSVNRLLMGESL